MLDVGQYQQAAPFANVYNYGKVIGALSAPTTVTNDTQLSPLNQVGSLLSFLGGPTGTGGALSQLGITGGLSGLIKSVGNAFNPTLSTNTNYKVSPNQTPSQAEIDAGLQKGDDGKWYIGLGGGGTGSTNTNDPGFESDFDVGGDTGGNDGTGTGDDEFFTGGDGTVEP